MIDNDSKRWDAFVNFELQGGAHWRRCIKIVSDSAGTPFPQNSGLSRDAVNRVKWLPKLMKRWEEHLDAEGNFKKRGFAKGTTRRLECLEEWWCDAFEEAITEAKAKGKDLIACGYIPGTEITSSSEHIIPEAYKAVHKRASEVVTRFVSGEFTVNRGILDGKKYSLLQAIESAFFQHGVRINPAHCIEASRDVKEHGLKSVIESSFWTTKSYQVAPATSGHVLTQLGIKLAKKISNKPASSMPKSELMVETEDLTEHQDMRAIPMVPDHNGLNDGKEFREQNRKADLNKRSMVETVDLTEDQDIRSIPMAPDHNSLNDSKDLGERKRKADFVSNATGQALPISKRSKVEDHKVVGEN